MRPPPTTATACVRPASRDASAPGGRALAAVLLSLLAGCSLPMRAPAPQPALEPIVVTAERREPAPQPAQRPAPRPAPRPVPPAAPAPEPSTGRIAIVLSDRSPAYENVAVEIGRRLERFLLYNLADRSLPPPAVFSGIADADAEVVIAIGLRAAEQALLMSPLPVVFCQVFNLEVEGSVVPVRGVAAIPPLAPQVRAWKAAHPELRTIGAIVGEGHDALIAEAQTATAEHGVGFEYRIASSDRETLYLFHRMAREIDGFWLFPDNRILSVPVLRELFRYARQHGVQVAVFNPALTELGAEVVAVSDPADVAATTIGVAERILDGEIDAVPALTPLGRVDVRISSAARPRAAAKGTH